MIREYGIHSPIPSLHADDDVVVEQWDFGRESTVQLSKDSDVMSRDAMNDQDFDDHFRFECLLLVYEREAQAACTLAVLR